MVRSCVYQGQVFHKRLAPRPHDFHYEMDYVFLDLSEIETVCGLSKIWSAEHKNLIAFYRQDYLPGNLPLSEEVRSTVLRLGGESFDGPICLLSTLRRLGHCMNPISLFYCYDAGKVKYVLAEVHNTPWDQRHQYLIDFTSGQPATPKDFHVSPFMPMDTVYDWQLSDPAETLGVGIKVSKEKELLFNASMSLTKLELTPETIAGINRRQLSQAFTTITAIYFQAARLWLKKTPFFPHPDKIKLQEN